MRRAPLSDLQTKIMIVLDRPQSSALTAENIAKAMREGFESPVYVNAGQLAGPLGGLRKRQLVGVRAMPCAPLRVTVNPMDRFGRGCVPVAKRHYMIKRKMKHMKAFKHIRMQCAKLFMQRFRALTYNQQQQALRGNWNV